MDGTGWGKGALGLMWAHTGLLQSLHAWGGRGGGGAYGLALHGWEDGPPPPLPLLDPAHPGVSNAVLPMLPACWRTCPATRHAYHGLRPCMTPVSATTHETRHAPAPHLLNDMPAGSDLSVLIRRIIVSRVLRAPACGAGRSGRAMARVAG